MTEPNNTPIIKPEIVAPVGTGMYTTAVQDIGFQRNMPSLFIARNAD
jgi:hypothetical protein